MNEKQFLEELISYNLENLKHIEFAPISNLILQAIKQMRSYLN